MSVSAARSPDPLALLPSNPVIVSVRCEAAGCKWRARFTRAALTDAASLSTAFERHHGECLHAKNMELERRNKELEARLLLLSQVKAERNEAAAAQPAAAAAAAQAAQPQPSPSQQPEARKESGQSKNEDNKHATTATAKESRAETRRSTKRSNKQAAPAAATTTTAGGTPAAASHSRSKAARHAQSDAAAAASASSEPAEILPPLESPHSAVSRASPAGSPLVATVAAAAAASSVDRSSSAKLIAMPKRHLAVMKLKGNSPGVGGGPEAKEKEEQEDNRNDQVALKPATATAAASPANTPQSSGRPSRTRFAPSRLSYDESNDFYRVSSCQIRASTLTRAMSYAGSTIPVYVQGHYHYLDFQQLLPLMVQRGLLTPRPPGAQGVIIGSAALEWLLFYRDHRFDWTPRCGSKKKYEGGFSYRPEVLEDALLVSGAPFIAASFVDEQMLFLAHMTDAEAKSKRAEVRELQKALQPVRAAEPATKALHEQERSRGGEARRRSS